MKFTKKISLKHIKHQVDLKHEIRRYVVLVLVPMIFCVALFYGMHRITLEQMQGKATSTVDMFVQMSTAIMHETEMVDNSLVSDFTYLSNTGNVSGLIYSYDDPDSICRQIAIRMESSSYIEHIYYISYQSDHIYSDEAYYDMASLDSILSRYGIDGEFLSSVEESTWKMIVMQLIKGPYNISPTRESNGEIDGYLITILDLDTFINTIFGLETQYACFYNENTFISSFPVSEEDLATDALTEEEVEEILGKKVKCFFTEVDDYTYMIAIEQANYYKPYRVMALLFLLYAVMVAAFGFVWLYRVSTERYEQLSSIITALDPEKPPATYQSLLLDIKEKLLMNRDTEKELKSEQKTLLFRDLIHNPYPKKTILSRMETLEIPVPETKYYATRFYLKANNNVALVSSHIEDTRQVMRTIFESALKQFTEHSLFSTFCCMDGDDFSVLFYGNVAEEFEREIMAACESISAFLLDEYGVDVHAAMSEVFYQPEEMQTAFLEVDDLEHYATAIANPSKLISGVILKEHGDLLLTGDFFKQEQTLFHTLLLKKYDAVSAMVESIVQEHIRNRAVGVKTAESRLQALTGILAESVYTIENDQINKIQMAEEFLEINSAAELVDLAQRTFTAITEAVAKEPVSYPKVDEACEYIEMHLSDTNLNVSMICEEVGVIVQRLTPMFQEKLGMGIAEYVNHKRIEEAKKILVGTKLTVKQIGEEVGYANTDTFTRNFRKLENMTPTEYRKLASN